MGSKPNGDDPKQGNATMTVAVRPRHRYGNSVDGTTSSSTILESIEAKKTIDPCSRSRVMNCSSQTSHKELQEFHSAMEEAKADILGIWLLKFPISKAKKAGST